MQTTSQFDLDRFYSIGRDIVIEGMQIVRPYQLGLMASASADIKPEDQSFLTEVDTRCGAMMRRLVTEQFPGVRSNIEDAGETGETASKEKIWGDPIDGTLPFTIGAPTSTVIMGAHDTEEQRVLACVIGEPATGRIWFTDRSDVFAGVVDYSTGMIENVHRVKVWSGKFSPHAGVLLDNPRGFTRGKDKRTILSHEEVGRLMDRLRDQRLQIYGSNGLHQALVAQGNDKMAGGITSAIGGPQDVVGVRLILNAGGSARAFRSYNGIRKDFFEEVPPESIEQYDILVYGNNNETVDRLSEMVLGLRR